MYITVHLSDGRKITKDKERLRWFSVGKIGGGGCSFMDISGRLLPEILDGYITINLDHVIDIRPAEDDEIKHAQIHGW